MSESIAFPGTQAGRYEKFLAELRHAVGQVSKDELKDWGVAGLKTFGDGNWRRLKGLGQLAARFGSWVVDEGRGAVSAYEREQLKDHFKQKGQELLEGGKELFESAKQSTVEYHQLVSKLPDSPKEVGPILAGHVIGFLAGSGTSGIGDGGIPDMDLLGGVGRHRSIFTHSLIAGAAAETAIFAFLDLTMRVYRHLPDPHDPAWDVLAQMAPVFAENLRKGTDAGIAFHLAWDATLDGMTPYKDLPVDGIPMLGHRVVLGANAAAEAKVSAESTPGIEKKTEKARKKYL